MLNRHHQPTFPPATKSNKQQLLPLQLNSFTATTPLSQVISKEQDHIENVWKMYYRALVTMPYQKEWKLDLEDDVY